MNAEPYILVIDDENYICESCDRIFSNAGYRVDTNMSADTGFRQALTNNYDAIILDLNLVETDGIQLLSGIRKRKPDVPVVIITGFPSEESRSMSTTLGVTDYIIKPFEPAELLGPVARVVYGEAESISAEKDYDKIIRAEPYFHYYMTSWFHTQAAGQVRVGGHYPNLSNNSIKSVILPDTGNIIYRGLPLAQITLSNGISHVIPSPVSGKVTLINKQLEKYPYILEKNIRNKNWIAMVAPDNLEEDIQACETRHILIFSGDSSEENEFFKQFKYKGYITEITSEIGKVLEILAKDGNRTLVMDARNLDYYGPGCVRRINNEFPDSKIIVINEPNLKVERLYRTNKLFYYGVYPVSNNEMDDLLYCAFNQDRNIMIWKNPNASRFLPDIISKISTTNKFGRKVTLLAYNNILKSSHGLGYMLTKELLDMSLPIEINQSRSCKSADDADEVRNITREKEKNDRIIILQTKDEGNITGSIVKEIDQFQNARATGNLLVKINIQPTAGRINEPRFDDVTREALKNVIKAEIVAS